VSGYVNKKQADEALNPKGNLTDYSTQEKIRYNTYSGIALTGIVANFSKVFGYIFDATPPTEIIDTKTGKVMSVSSEEVQNLMKENDAPTIERLIEKLPYIKISGRQRPTFKKMGFEVERLEAGKIFNPTTGKEEKNVVSRKTSGNYIR
jgi:hypothetical protein